MYVVAGQTFTLCNRGMFCLLCKFTLVMTSPAEINASSKKEPLLLCLFRVRFRMAGDASSAQDDRMDCLALELHLCLMAGGTEILHSRDVLCLHKNKQQEKEQESTALHHTHCKARLCFHSVLLFYPNCSLDVKTETGTYITYDLFTFTKV